MWTDNPQTTEQSKQERSGEAIGLHASNMVVESVPGYSPHP